jgi:hypothetical protein
LTKEGPGYNPFDDGDDDDDDSENQKSMGSG